MISADGIASILEEQVLSCRKLLNLLRSERVCLLELDAEGIEELVKEKDTLALRLRLLDEERLRLMEKFCADNDQAGPPGGLTLQRLAEMTGDGAFLEIRSKMVSLIQSIEELNSFNRMLIERSLNYVQSAQSFFSSFCPGTDGKGTLLSREM
jgi:flagellar biosynthesis/type III secretory pathway chaperone